MKNRYHQDNLLPQSGILTIAQLEGQPEGLENYPKASTNVLADDDSIMDGFAQLKSFRMQLYRMDNARIANRWADLSKCKPPVSSAPKPKEVQTTETIFTLPDERVSRLDSDKSEVFIKNPRPLVKFYKKPPKAIVPPGKVVLFDHPEYDYDLGILYENYANNEITKIAPNLTSDDSFIVYESMPKKDKPKRMCNIPIDTLKFESRFESGNLATATRVIGNTYSLQLEPDLNTAGHTQWYYFRVENMTSGIPYTFCITNLMKKDCLYEQGMKPLMYSVKQAKEEHVGWRRVGEQIQYIENTDQAKLTTYTLTFTVKFKYSTDTVYFAHCYPYTYSYLQNIDLLSITNQVNDPQELKKRKVVIITSRIHPGETNSSWVMHGLLKYLVGDSDEAKYLRQNYVFKLLPMLNPDGVIAGNHRCNFFGFDLNRQWIATESNAELVPELVEIKNMIRRNVDQRNVVFYCDIHGHKNHEKVFPLMLWKVNPSSVFLQRCHFKLQKKKLGTARIVFRKEFDIINSFTLEISFCGSDKNRENMYHFSLGHLKEFGRDFGKTLFEFLVSKGYEAKSINQSLDEDDQKIAIPCPELKEINCALANGTLTFESTSSDEDSTSDDEVLRKVYESTVKKKVLKKKAQSKTIKLSGRPSTSGTSSRSSLRSKTQSLKSIMKQNADNVLPSRSNSVISFRLQTPSPLPMETDEEFRERQSRLYGLNNGSEISSRPSSARCTSTPMENLKVRITNKIKQYDPFPTELSKPKKYSIMNALLDAKLPVSRPSSTSTLFSQRAAILPVVSMIDLCLDIETQNTPQQK